MKWKLLQFHSVVYNKLPLINFVFIRAASSAIALSYKLIGRSAVAELTPLIFVHGLLGNKQSWGSIGKTLHNVTKRPVVTVDLRNQGKSPHANSHTYVEMTEDILLLIKKLDVDKAILIGNSTGGRACMCVALTKPEVVAGLILVEMSPVSNTPRTLGFPKVMAAMSEIDFTGQKLVTEARKMAKEHLRKVTNDENTLRKVLCNVNLKPNGMIGWTCNLPIIMKYFTTLLHIPKSLKKKSYIGPTLFIGGQYSEFLPPDDLPSIRDLFPAAIVIYIKKAGHDIQIDNTQAFTESVLSFLNVYFSDDQ